MTQVSPPQELTLQDPALYINRELSWLEFNARVLEEALDNTKPLLERVRFLGIFSTNLDEFYMIRVAGLRKQIAAGVYGEGIAGQTPIEQLEAVREAVIPLRLKQLACWVDDVLPKLAQHGVHILKYGELISTHKKIVRQYFEQEILPVLTPLAVDPGRPFPHISNLSLNLAIMLEDANGSSHFARVKVPTTGKFPRYLQLNQILAQYDASSNELDYALIMLEDAIIANLDLLFPGMIIKQAYPFRVIRDADVEIAEDEASDLLESIAESVQQRQFGEVVQLIVPASMPDIIKRLLTNHLAIHPRDLYEFPDPLGLNDLFEIVDLELPHLKYRPFVQRRSPFFPPEKNIFDVVRAGDVMMFHPYESFDPTIEFIQKAANDPDVLALKISLYRTGRDSPIVQALLDARENGKQVAALVELKARFDEENNIVWARALEAKGVHVVYGLMGLKTHAKICLVVRREGNHIRRYAHLSTGNYNARTAREYSDLSFFTCREDFGEDLTQLFNRITGFAPDARYHKLFVAPEDLRTNMLALIHREIKHAKQGHSAHIIAKMNSLTDKEIISTLYEASQAGVRVDLIVRGICCLRPGIPNISENIHVRSIVGRFLEHARIFWFENNNKPEVYAGSADWMERNLNRRVEQIFPIEDKQCQSFAKNILTLQLTDNISARILQADGTWQRLHPASDEEVIDCQSIFLKHRDNLLELPMNGSPS